MPALEKGAQREVHVLHKCSRIPSARGVDARLSPHAASAVEVEEVARREARVLLALDVRVQADLLVAAEERFVGVQVGPAPLHETDVFVLEDRHRAQQKVGLGEEVGVEDGDELARDRIVHLVHRTGLIALPVRATDRLNVEASLAPVEDALVDDGARLWIGGVVQALDVELVARILHSA